jgi:thioredoxin-related protein
MKNFLFTSLLLLFAYAATAQEKSKIEWISIEEAFARTSENPKKVIIDVYTDWCGWCKRMDATTFANPTIAAYISENFYAVKLDAERKDTVTVGNQTFVNENPERRRNPHNMAIALMQGKMSYPTIVYLDETFNLIQSVPGYQTPETIEPILHFLNEDNFKEIPWEEYQKSFKSNLK